MNFWTLAGLWRRGHGLILGAICGICFLTFFIACLTDLNHPPGTRSIRLLTLGFILFVGLIEYFWAWRGIAIFTLLWPFQLLIKHLLARDVSGLFSAIPDLFDWPLASAFTIAIVVRQLRTIPPDPFRIEDVRLGLIPKFLPALLYIFSMLTVLSALTAYARLIHAPPEWGVQPPDFRRVLFVYNPLSILRLIWVGIPIVVNSLLTIALMRAIFFERKRQDALKWPLITFLVGMSISFGIVIYQIVLDFHWEFDDGPPGGPFSNRNVLAPMLILAGVGFLSLYLFLSARFLKYILPAIALIFVLLAIRTGSRNGVFLAAALPWSCLLIGASVRKTVAVTVLTAVIASVLLFWVPLPKSNTVQIESISRSVRAIEDIRAGNWDVATSYRNHLWAVAWKTAKSYPLLGGGPGTYYFHSSQVPETRIELVRIHQVPGILAHSTPINLMAEIGIPAALLWILIWVILPAEMMMKHKSFAPPILGLFLVGMSNVFDTPWYVSGGMTIAAFWLCLAIYEHKTWPANHA